MRGVLTLTIGGLLMAYLAAGEMLRRTVVLQPVLGFANRVETGPTCKARLEAIALALDGNNHQNIVDFENTKHSVLSLDRDSCYIGGIAERKFAHFDDLERYKNKITIRLSGLTANAPENFMERYFSTSEHGGVYVNRLARLWDITMQFSELSSGHGLWYYLRCD